MAQLISSIISFIFVLLAPIMVTAQSNSLLGSFSETERQLIHSEIRAYLHDNPEVIIEALQRAIESTEVDANLIAAHSEKIFNDTHSYVGGNPEGDITLVEFLDYRCHYCKKVHPQIDELLIKDPNIRLIIKEFPILGPNSVIAGRMAVAAVALDSGKYKALNDALMRFPGSLTENIAYRIAANAGYDIGVLRNEAAKEATTKKLQANYKLAQTMRLNGTPSFILEDEIIRGFVSAKQLQARVNEKRRTKTELR